MNIGKEKQKSGIEIDDLPNFLNLCRDEYNLNIIGLMCLPPLSEDPSKYFEKMKTSSLDLSLRNLSMGMSNDYLKAIKYNANFIRVGSKIFGERSQ